MGLLKLMAGSLKLITSLITHTQSNVGLGMKTVRGR